MQTLDDYWPTHLPLWTMPDNYIGPTWKDHYVFLSQHRDSDALTRSNFTVALSRLGGANGDTIQVVRERHWAVGWIEWIAIHQDDMAALKLADDMMQERDDYPVLDEDHFSDLEDTEAADYWAGMCIRDRIYLLDKCDMSIFHARHDYRPSDDSGRLDELLRGC
jgi:hypothetical protein